MHGQKFSVLGLKKACTKVINFIYCAKGTYVLTDIHNPKHLRKGRPKPTIIGEEASHYQEFCYGYHICKQLHMRLSIGVYNW